MKGSHLIHSQTPQALQDVGIVLTSDVTEDDGTRYVYLASRGHWDQGTGESVMLDEPSIAFALSEAMCCEVERLRQITVKSYSLMGGADEYVATVRQREAVAA